MVRRPATPLVGTTEPPVKGAPTKQSLWVSAGRPTTVRGRKTRAALLSAARDVFEELGFRNARISDIASRAGTSYGVFYHYFESKEEILDELFATVTGEMYTVSQTASGESSSPVDRIRAANRQYLAVAARNAKLIATIEELAFREERFRELKLRIREPFLRRNETGIRHLQERGLADPDIDAAIAASMLGGMIEHFTMMWFVHGVTYEEELAVETLTRLWAQAIGVKVLPLGLAGK